MINRKAAVLCAATGLLLSGASLRGQEIPSPYRFVETRQEAGAFFGNGYSNPGQLGLGLDSGRLIGGRYMIEFGSAVGLEVNASLLKSERDVRDIRREEGDQIIGRTDSDAAALELRMRINLTGHRTWHRFQPFIALGGGLATGMNFDREIELAAELPPIDVYEFGTVFLASAGGGFSYHLSKRLVLRVDGILGLWKANTPDGYLDATRDVPLDLTTVPDGEWVAIRTLTIGTSWRF